MRVVDCFSCSLRNTSRAVGRHGDRQVVPGNAHLERLRGQAAAAAEGLEAQVLDGPARRVPGALDGFEHGHRAAGVELAAGRQFGDGGSEVDGRRAFVRHDAFAQCFLQVREVAELAGMARAIEHLHGHAAAPCVRAQPLRHQHQRRDADAARYQQVAGGRKVERKVVLRRAHLQPVAGGQPPHGERAATAVVEPLDRDAPALAVALANERIRTRLQLALRHHHLHLQVGAGLIRPGRAVVRPEFELAHRGRDIAQRNDLRLHPLKIAFHRGTPARGKEDGRSATPADQLHTGQRALLGGGRAMQRLAQVAARDAAVLAHQRLGARALAGFDGVEHLHMLVLRDHEHVARGRRIGLHDDEARG
jgi:hypothetical protein